MLFSLALGNLRRNFRNYWAYFLSSAFSVFVLYLFLTIVYGRVTGSASAFQSTQVIFGIGAVLTALFAAFFIWYSNSFFVKSRKKEFATYMLLGMSKRQTIRLNFLENLAILALAFVTGLAFGMLLNKFLIMLLLHIMGESAYVPFEINLRGLKVCAAVYAGVFALTAVHSALLLARNSLLSLIQASRKAEKVMRASARTWVVGVFALLLLGLGYFLAAAFGGNILTWPPIVLFVVIGTVLLFTGAVSLFLHHARRNEAKLYRGTRLVTVSQLMHRYRGNVGALSVIAVTTSVALCAVLSCCGTFGAAGESTRTVRPFSVEYASSTAADKVVVAAQKAHPEIGTATRADAVLLKATGRDADGGQEYKLYLISQSNYNAILRAQGRTDFATLAGGHDCLYLEYFQPHSDRSRLAGMPGKGIVAECGAGTLRLTVSQTSSRIFLSIDRYRRVLVLPDTLFASVRAGSQKYDVTGWMLQNDARSGAFSADLHARAKAEGIDKEALGTDAEGDNVLIIYYDDYAAALQALGVLMFVGVFIGLLFIAATGGILYFRMAMEAAEDRENFITLLRIGMSAGELRCAVAKELAVIFAAPFALAALNTFMARFPLERLVNLNMTGTYFVMLALYGAAYGLYYLLALRKYVRTVGG